jgi:hypothetical protein
MACPLLPRQDRRRVRRLRLAGQDPVSRWIFRSDDRHPVVLERGTVIDRFGDPNGRYLSPAGTPFDDRAIPGDSLDKGYHRYEVVREIPAWMGGIAPAMGFPGGGIQYLSPHSVEDLVLAGYLKEI